jgi:hypothetical protein
VEWPTRLAALAALSIAGGLAAALALWREPEAPAPPAPVTAAPAPPEEIPAPPVPDGPAAGAPAPSEPDAGADLADLAAAAWAGVDLEEVRARLPDNLYWQTAAPTTDERVLREREEEKARWNDVYGKVLSGTGTEEEIESFYERRQRLSSDSIQFVDYLLEHYGAALPEQGQELLHVARRLHLARLQEIPRRLQEAMDRKRAQDAAREAWLADQAEFERDDAAPPSEM